MTWNRREVLGGLGIASAHALLFAFGCGPRTRPVRPQTEASGSEVRAWLREAVAVIHGAGAGVTGHALAVTRRHTSAARDVLGAGVAHGRYDGVVLTARDERGRREQVTSELTREGVLDAARALAGNAAPAKVEFGPPPAAASPRADVDAFTDTLLLDNLDGVQRRDQWITSRIVYAAGLLEIDDATVWSVAAGHDLEQRLIRVRRGITRVAWNGTRPIVGELVRAWAGGIRDQTFSDEELAHANEIALALMTPGAFDDGEHALVLAPDVVAGIVDAAARQLYTTPALRRPEIAARLASDAMIASPQFTLVDDPTIATAYGGFRFDDAGEVAAALPLIERGKLVGRIARARRPGHLGALEVAPSHLRVAAGESKTELALDDGFLLDGVRGVVIDPASDRIVVSVQRAREVKHGQRTGRAYTDVELVSTLASLLGSIGEATQATRTIGIRDERDGFPRWRSVEAPWLRAKALVRARRRTA